MEETFSDDFKKYFLIKFTKELINHSSKAEIINLQKIIELKEKRIEKKETEKEVLVPATKIILPKKEEKPKIQFTKPVVKNVPSTLFIPEPKLPSNLEYLKPVPTTNVEIDLSKLNPLIKDPAVRIVEVNPDEKVIVTGAMGTKSTNITLNKEDIDRVINAFSVSSRIPISEGIYKVAVGNLILSAIISDVVGSKFIIRKMITPTAVQQMPQQQVRRNNFR